MSRGNTPENRVKRECLEYLNDIATLGGLAVVARSYRDIDQALRKAGYNGITDGPLFGAFLAGEGND